MPASDTPSYDALIVEDSDDIANILKMALDQLGIHSRRAADGPRALDLVEQHVPDLLLLDIGLPSMSGWDVLDAIKTRYPDANMPVIVLSAFGDPANRLVGKFQRHVFRYFVKPFDVREVTQAVREALNME